MKAVVASKIGPYADVLSLCNVPKPELLPGTALVRVLSAGLAFPDVLVVEGKHMMRKEPPFTPGQEICGQVVAVGEGVTTVAVGQQVFGPCVSGGLAEFALVDADECFSAPRAMDPHTAAGFELNYGTSWHGLVDLAGLRAGETLLVLGASGGIGLSAIAIGVARGARVVAAASSDARLDACRQAGAHVALSYAGGGKALKAALAEAAVYGEVDVVLDPVGGELSEVAPPPAALCNRGCHPMQQRLRPHACMRACSRCPRWLNPNPNPEPNPNPRSQVAFRALGWGGRFLVVGFASGGAAPKAAIPRLPLNLALLNERRVPRHVASPACRLGGGAAVHCPGLLGLTPQGLGCAAHSGRAAAPLRAEYRRLPCGRGARPKSPMPMPRRMMSHQVLGVFWGAWKARERDANRANIEAMLGLISRGELRPPRGRVYRLHEWRTAFDDLMQRRAVGKVCIDLGTVEARL